jgi:hypothetical protein
VFARPRRLAPDKLKIAEAELKKLKKAGVTDATLTPNQDYY